MQALSIFVALQVASYGPPDIPALGIGQPVQNSDCPIPNGNEIVLCKARKSANSDRYTGVKPTADGNALSAPFVIKLPGGGSIKGFRQLTIPF
ncbi:hypothetical protein [Sphingomonas sp. PR090111-T3T-6A]|uniref:hypothetical protein n=1 Tax=Sphingomonas sp. PR090111-T3T-6A TaxID=685778 RepID=UPI0012FB0718|nr:hypothetical protein [Sphingomonas sp. PR090111-T3T-6A]